MFDKALKWFQNLGKHEAATSVAAITTAPAEPMAEPVAPSAADAPASSSMSAIEKAASVLEPKLTSLSAPGSDAPTPIVNAVPSMPVVKQPRHPWNWLGVEGYNKRKAWRNRQRAKKAEAAAVAEKAAVEKFVAEQDAGKITTPHSLMQLMELEAAAKLLRQQKIDASSVVATEEPVASTSGAAPEVLVVEPTVEPVAQTTEPVPINETPLEKVQREYAAMCAAQHAKDTRPVNWSDEIRKDLPMRTPGRIQFLLLQEESESRRRGLSPDRFTGAPALTAARIRNDIDRNAYGSNRVSVDQNGFMVRPGSDGKQQVW